MDEILAQIVKQNPALLELGTSFPSSQKSATGL